MGDLVRLVISDLHIGSLFSKEEEIYSLINSIEFDELILAGDIIDFIKIPSFTNYSAQIFNLVREIGKSKRIIYIVGNHDLVFHSFIGKTVGGIEFVSDYEFEYNNRKYRIEHGDRYDKGVVKWRFMMNIVSVFHDILERKLNLNLAAWWVRVMQKKRQLKRVWHIMKECNDDVDVFIMGHTHEPECLIWVDSEERIRTYVNTGDWIEHQTYVLIKEGNVRLKTFNK